MDPVEYDRWWPLHLRVTRGEQLPPADRQFYDDGVRQLERLDSSISSSALAALEVARRRIADLQREQRVLHARRGKIESEIAAAEAALCERARDLLGAKE